MASVVDSQHYSNERHKLFTDLKLAIERTVGQHSADVLYVHGSIDSVLNCLDGIFKHGNKPNQSSDYWEFVYNLRWLVPMFASEIEEFSKYSVTKSNSDALQGSLKRRKAKTRCQHWLESTLKMKKIYVQVKALISDQSPINEYYFDWAFLLDTKHRSAMMICLSAWECNSAGILAEIPFELLARSSEYSAGDVRVHRPKLRSMIKEEKEALDISQNVKEKRSLSLDPLCGVSIAGSQKPEKNFMQQSFRQPAHSTDCHEDMGNQLASTDFLKQCLPVHAARRNEMQKLLESNRTSKLGTSSSAPLFADSSDEFDDYSISLFSKPQQKNDLRSLDNPTALKPSNNGNDLWQGQTLLPDVVVSAEESILFQSYAAKSLEESAIEGLQQPLVCDNVKLDVDYYQAATSQDGYQIKASDELPNRTIFTHRRCKSDHQKPTFSPDHFSSTNTKPTKPTLKPSVSMPLLNDIQRRPSNSEQADGGSVNSHSLMNYLQSQDLTTCADIDKENAHFHLSEMVIGAIEQAKCKMSSFHASRKCEGQIDNVAASHLDPNFGFESPYVDYEPADDISASYSSNTSHRYHSPVGSIGSEQLADSLKTTSELDAFPIAEDSPPSSAPYLKKERPSRSESARTAESIAIGLLKTFSHQPQVTAEDLEWLISEDDVPQKLLPLPMSVAIDPDSPNQANEVGKEQGVRIRGNQDWAPPRRQIIFKAPVKLKLKAAMVKQNNRCAGCGTVVTKAFIKRSRYCEYLGKYFCTCCHNNKLSWIPAYILQKFDFTGYKVSNFAYELLSAIHDDPLFNVNDINPSLYKKVKSLASVQKLRQQLVLLYKYIQVCRFANSRQQVDEVDETIPLTDCLEKQMSTTFPSHILTGDIHVYSISDLQKCKSGVMNGDLKKMVEAATKHVDNCQLCQVKGFICEVCDNEKSIIFPFQHNTSSCSKCHACFHSKCYDPSNCPKCKRISKRRQRLLKA